MVELTPELLNQSTFVGALFLILVSASTRWWRGGSFLDADRMILDLLNSAAVVPLLAFIGGLFFPELRAVMTSSNNILVVLVCSVALVFVLRSLFKPDADEKS